MRAFNLGSIVGAAMLDAIVRQRVNVQDVGRLTQRFKGVSLLTEEDIVNRVLARTEARLYHLARRRGELTKAERQEQRGLETLQDEIRLEYINAGKLRTFNKVVLETQHAVEAAEQAEPAPAAAGAVPPQLLLDEATLRWVGGRYDVPVPMSQSVAEFRSGIEAEWQRIPKEAMEQTVRMSIRIRYLSGKARSNTEQEEFAALVNRAVAAIETLEQRYPNGVGANALKQNIGAAGKVYERVRAAHEKRRAKSVVRRVDPAVLRMHVDQRAAPSGTERGAPIADYEQILQRIDANGINALLNRAAQVQPRLKYLYAISVSPEQRAERVALQQRSDALFQRFEALGKRREWDQLNIDIDQALRNAGQPPAIEAAPEATPGLVPSRVTAPAVKDLATRMREWTDRLRALARALPNENAQGAALKYLRDTVEDYATHYPGAQRRYVATMFAPKADPLGLYALVDCVGAYHADGRTETTNIDCWLAGAQPVEGKGLRLGAGYSEEDLKTIEGKQYVRSHTPDGVAATGAGMGFVLYSTHALVGHVLRGAAGCWSYKEGRSSSASKWWNTATQRRPGKPAFAERIEQRVEGGYAKHCEPINKRHGLINPEGRQGLIRPEETTVCHDVDTVWHTNPVDVLTAESVMKSGLVVFGLLNGYAVSDLPLKSGHKPFWDKADVGPAFATENDLNTGLFYTSGRNSVYRRTSGRVAYAMTKMRAELFARSFHGPSPLLAGVILNLLASRYEEQAVIYATRPDIAPLLVGHSKLARIIRAKGPELPGLQGLSKAAHREICGALSGVEDGTLTIDHGSKNPLGLPKVSAETRTLLSPYADL